MKHLHIIFLASMLFPLVVCSQNYYGYFGDGAWTDVANWDTYPGETLAADDYVYIFGNISESTATITNNGIIELHGSITLLGTVSFTNTGDIEIMTSGRISLNSGTTFTNNLGDITLNGAITNDAATFINTGVSAIIDNREGDFINRNGALFTNDLDAGVSVYLSGSFINDNATIENKNAASFFSGAIQGIQNINGGIFQNVSSGRVTTSIGGFDNTSGSIFNNDAIVFLSDGGFVNREMAVFNNNQNGTVNVRYFSTFSNRSFFNNNAGATIFADADSRFFNITDGVLLNNSIITTESFLYNDAILGGVNTAHTGVFENYNILSPGNSVGTYIITGNYIQAASGILEIEIEGTGANYDVLQADNLIIDGTLSVTLPTMYDPQIGDIFTIITGNSITGTFANEMLPTLSSDKMWQVNYSANEIRLEVTNTLAVDRVEKATKIVLYPNPAKTVVFIENLQPSSNNQYTIFSILGETIQQGTVQQNKINISQLRTGSYYIKIDAEVFTLLKQ